MVECNYQEHRKCFRLFFALLFGVLVGMPLCASAQSSSYTATIGGNRQVTAPHNPTVNADGRFTAASFVTIQNNSSQNMGFKIITEITVYDSGNNVVSRQETGSTVTVPPGGTHQGGNNASTTQNVGGQGEKTAKARQKVLTDTNEPVTDGWVEFPNAADAPFMVLAGSGGGNQNQE